MSRLQITALVCLLIAPALFAFRYSRPAFFPVLFWELTIIGATGLLAPFLIYPKHYPTTVVLLAVIALFNIVVLSGPRLMAAWGNIVGTNRFAAAITILVLSSLIPFGAAEVVADTLTSTGAWKIEPPLITQLKPGTEDWRAAHITADALMEPDPVLFWRPKKKAPYNSQRFKGPEAVLPKPANVFRVMAYGDSNTDGPKAGSWPEQLHKILNSSPGRFQYEVLNAGVAGYSSYQGLRRLEQEIATYRPDLVLVSFGWNDLPAPVSSSDHEYRVPSRPIIAAQRLLLNYRFYLAIRQHVRSNEVPVVQSEMPRHRVDLAHYLANMSEFARVGHQHGAAVVFLTRPHRDGPDELARQSTWRRHVPIYNQALVAFSNKTSAVVVDVQQLFEDKLALFVDECHFTFEGHSKMAGLLRDILKEKGLLDKRVESSMRGLSPRYDGLDPESDEALKHCSHSAFKTFATSGIETSSPCGLSKKPMAESDKARSVTST